MGKGILFGTLAVLLAAAVLAYGVAGGWFGGEPLGPGVIEGEALPPEAVAERKANYRGTDGFEESGRQILFGDLHVHTTFSLDAFTLSLPLLQGEGAHPPADACDFARYCSALDFWSINDHAEGMTPAQWSSTKDIVRQCNAKAGDPANPDMVTFLGWEWTQIGSKPENHYGHKNVIFLDTEEGKVPARPIGAEAQPGALSSWAVRGLPFRQRLAIALDSPGGDFETYQDAMRFMADRRALDKCPEGVPVRDLPEDCRETAETPRDLFAKLDDWGFPSMVIPHGTTWGFYTPPGSTLDKQLEPGLRRPGRQPLFEIFSGHGNSEEYRDFRAVKYDENGEPYCPEPTDDYLPSCWRAGQIIQKRCREEGLPHAECERRTRMARENYVQAGVSGFRTVPGATPGDWLNAGQCQDCFLPAFNYRPGGSAQYALAIGDFGGEGEPRRFRFGVIGSSDNHRARPGTGFKEIDRYENTEGGGPGKPGMINDPERDRKAPRPESEPFDPMNTQLAAFDLVEAERQASFFMLGGLVAVHAQGRDRRAIWEALKRREVYATSGERILLWFEMETDGGTVRMGGAAQQTSAPRFTVRALGAFEQKPGCPDYAVNGLSGQRLENLCKGECYHPSDTRKRITHIEIVRIRPQVRPDEPVESLIEDPWRRFACDKEGAGCSVTFEDEEFAGAARDAVYYARAVQEPTPTINAENLRCTYDEAGRCVKVNPCYKDYRTAYEEECRAESAERAWSSPIFVDYGEPDEG
ncbi:MAG: DUF3604 domain-containing protein [Alphaproteobacteria bacterium]